MFVLNYNSCEVFAPKSFAFATHREARDEMRKQVMESAERNGYDLTIVGNFIFDSDGELKGDFGFNWASIWELDEWVICEIHGAFIPADVAKGMLGSIQEASAMYGDESRWDYYDADDICQEVCWELEGYLK